MSSKSNRRPQLHTHAEAPGCRRVGAGRHLWVARAAPTCIAVGAGYVIVSSPLCSWRWRLRFWPRCSIQPKLLRSLSTLVQEPARGLPRSCFPRIDNVKQPQAAAPCPSILHHLQTPDDERQLRDPAPGLPSRGQASCQAPASIGDRRHACRGHAFEGPLLAPITTHHDVH